jgi:hypothetical protein
VKCTLRFGGEPLALSGLPNSDAERAYGLIRENLVRYQTPFAPPQAGAPPYPRPAAPPAPTTGYCKKCGFSVIPGEKYCGNCGSAV